MYDEIYVGASLSILIKLYFKKNKILVIEKENNFGGAWRNSYKHLFKNIDLACHLIVTQSKKHSDKIIKFLKKNLGISLMPIEKKNLFFDSNSFKAYGKNGPALICKTGWSDMLNKVHKLVSKKKNITFKKNIRVSKIILKNDECEVVYGKNKRVYGKSIHLPTYCDLSEFYYYNKKVLFPFTLIKNYHYIFHLNAKSNILNNHFQGFWEKDNSNIFDRLSISSTNNINKKTSSFIICARVSKKFKLKLNSINKKSILNFFIKNNLIDFGNIISFKRIAYNCPYRSNEDLIKINKMIKKYNYPINILNTRYMGHYLWEILKYSNQE